MTRTGTMTLAVALFALASAAQADSEGGWTRGYDHMMWGAGYGMSGGLMMLVFWGLIIALVVFTVRRFSSDGAAAPKSGAREILRDRFARGEIDEEEYRKRLAVLAD